MEPLTQEQVMEISDRFIELPKEKQDKIAVYTTSFMLGYFAVCKNEDRQQFFRTLQRYMEMNV